MEFGWVLNTGLGTMLNYRDRVFHDRKNEKDTSEWRSKIGKLLVDGYNGGTIISTNIPYNVIKNKGADGPDIKLESDQRVSVLLLSFVNISVGEAIHMVFSLDAKNKQVIFVKLVMIIHCSVKAQSRLLLNHHFCLTTKQPNFFKFFLIDLSYIHMLCVIKSQSILFHHLTMLRKEIIISFPDSNYMSI